MLAVAIRRSAVAIVARRAAASANCATCMPLSSSAACSYPVEKEAMDKYKRSSTSGSRHFNETAKAVGGDDDMVPDDKSQQVIDAATGRTPIEDSYNLPHPIWSKKEVETVKITHRKPEGFVDRAAYFTVLTLR